MKQGVWGRRTRSLAPALAFVATAATLGVAVTPLVAGAFQEELGTDEAKILDRAKDDNAMGGDGSDSGRGPRPYLPALGAPPKRVGLVTFYVKDSGNSEKHPYIGVYRDKNVTASAVDTYANELYDASIAGIKEGFKAHGMELLTPKEFLDTPEKKQAYESFEPNFSAASKFANWVNKGNKDSTKLIGVAEEFRLIALPIENNAKQNTFELLGKGQDGKLMQGMGHDLAVPLGLDAVVVIYNIVQAQAKSIDMLSSYIYMFGPNPVKRDDDPSLYWTGHFYGGAKMKLDVSFVKTDRKGVASESDFAGWAPVGKALALKLGEHLEERTRSKKS